jgi:hypothetical protein
MEFFIKGPAGNLEAAFTDKENAKGTAIVCHPHSLYGGTMNNKVVTTLARTFGDLGLRTGRFNFRGVGKSDGSYDAGIGETDDLLAVVNWVKQNYPDDDLWFAGFSFGSYVAARAATEIAVAQLVTVAPPVINFDFLSLKPITCPWLIVQGDQDEIVSPQAVFDWIETLNPKPILIRMPGSSHFFHGQLMELRRQLYAALQK